MSSPEGLDGFWDDSPLKPVCFAFLHLVSGVFFFCDKALRGKSLSTKAMEPFMHNANNAA